MRRKTMLLAAALAAACLAALALTQGPAEAAFPGGDGRIALVCVPQETPGWDICTVRPDGTGRRNLTHDVAYDTQPAWSPDGRLIAFVRGGADPYSEKDIFVMRADGTGLRRLTDAPGDESAPAWSPDGRRIAYTDGVDAPIDVMRADGSRKRNVPNTEGGRDPSWSPDGRRIAFGDSVPTEDPYDDDNDEVFTVRTDGTGLTNVTDSPSQDREPDWSPDGSKIAFASDRTGELSCDPDRSTSCNVSGIYVANRDGSGPERVSGFGGFARDVSPTWSPTGTRLAVDTSDAGVGSDVFVTNADGTGLTNITATEYYSPEGNFDPAWRPRPRR